MLFSTSYCEAPYAINNPFHTVYRVTCLLRWLLGLMASAPEPILPALPYFSSFSSFFPFFFFLLILPCCLHPLNYTTCYLISYSDLRPFCASRATARTSTSITFTLERPIPTVNRRIATTPRFNTTGDKPL